MTAVLHSPDSHAGNVIVFPAFPSEEGKDVPKTPRVQDTAWSGVVAPHPSDTYSHYVELSYTPDSEKNTVTMVEGRTRVTPMSHEGAGVILRKQVTRVIINTLTGGQQSIRAVRSHETRQRPDVTNADMGVFVGPRDLVEVDNIQVLGGQEHESAVAGVLKAVEAYRQAHRIL